MSRYILDGRTLVLNRSWTAISTTSVRNAVGLVFRDVARVVCPETFTPHDFESWATLSNAREDVPEGAEYIQAVSMKVRVPEVVVLRRYGGFPRRGVAFSRRNLYRRDDFTCQYCGAQPGTELLSIDHVIPRSRGGTSTWENCVLACLDCNKRKASRTLEEAGLRLKRAPARPPGGAEFEVSLGTRRRSWERFISERYWNVELTA
jgi:5-methylcytosine-specific restriction endonuclease McrA